MLIKSLLIPKESVVVATVDNTIEDVLHLMKQNNIRCMPILDSTKTLFKGNIYRYHIYQHIAKGGSITASLVPLIKNATKFIHLNDSFYSLFFTLNDLPHVSVLDDKQKFIGIIKHTDVMTMLAQSWNLSDSSYALTIEVSENKTSLLQVIKLIKKYTGITNVITFERDDYFLRRRILVNLPRRLDDKKYDKLKEALQKHHYYIVDTEDLTKGI